MPEELPPPFEASSEPSPVEEPPLDASPELELVDEARPEPLDDPPPVPLLELRPPELPYPTDASSPPELVLPEPELVLDVEE